MNKVNTFAVGKAQCPHATHPQVAMIDMIDDHIASREIAIAVLVKFTWHVVCTCLPSITISCGASFVFRQGSWQAIFNCHTELSQRLSITSAASVLLLLFTKAKSATAAELHGEDGAAGGADGRPQEAGLAASHSHAHQSRALSFDFHDACRHVLMYSCLIHHIHHD